MIRINLTKKEIINSIYMQIGFSKKISETLLEDILESVLKNIIKHKKVKISKFGTFTLRKKNQRLGRNPKTTYSWINRLIEFGLFERISHGNYLIKNYKYLDEDS